VSFLSDLPQRRQSCTLALPWRKVNCWSCRRNRG
jgi:hypothetical protein